MKNRLENLERVAEQLAPIQPALSFPQNDLGYQISAEWHPFPSEESSESYHSEVQTSRTLEQPDPIQSTCTRNQDILEDDASSFLFSSAQEAESTSLYDDSFWIPGETDYAVTDLLPISDPSLDLSWGSLSTNSQPQNSTDTFTENDTSIGGEYVFNFPEDSESTVSPPTLELPHQHSPLAISTLAVPASSLQLYKDPRKAKSNFFESTDNKKISAELIQHLRLDDTKENQCLVSTAVARGHNIRDVFLSGLQALGNKEQVALSLPDVHKNSLTLVRTSTLQAYLTVASAAGIHIPDLYLNSTLSPFYKPNATPTDVASLLPLHASRMPPDLHPTAPQILYPHRPWLDLLPFPTLRKRALTLTSMEPPMIDLAELKSDIFFNNGLFCWRASGKGGSGHPWDRRSWEAEEWFLRKWWILIGGEEGNVVFQTRW